MVFVNRSGFRKLALLVVVLSVALIMVAGHISSGTAAPPAQQPGVVEEVTASNLLLNYQGRLLDPATGNPKDGTFLMTFRLYDVATGGAALWTEQKNVVVTSGLFITLLGDTADFSLAYFDGRPLWLGVTVGPVDPEAAPRMRVAYTPYALHAENAAQLGGQIPSAFAVAGHTHTGATIVDGSLALAELAAGSVDSSKIVDGSVALGDLADNSVNANKIVDGTVGDAEITDRTAMFSFPAHALNYVPGTVITEYGSGLLWQASYLEAAYLIVRRPPDWDGVHDVVLHLWFFANTSASGNVQFFIRPRAFNSGSAYADASSIDAVAVPGGSLLVRDQSVAIPAARLNTGNLWVITIQRGGGLETHTGPVVLMSVVFAYSALR